MATMPSVGCKAVIAVLLKATSKVSVKYVFLLYSIVYHYSLHCTKTFDFAFLKKGKKPTENEQRFFFILGKCYLKNELIIGVSLYMVSKVLYFDKRLDKYRASLSSPTSQ